MRRSARGIFALVAATAASVAVVLPALAQEEGGDLRVSVAQKTSRGWSGCPYVATDDRPIVGGCVAEARMAATFRIVTPFGVVPFADCTFSFDAHIAGNGSVALYGIAAGGASPCGDIRSCRLDTDSDRQPWLGEIVAEGSDRLQLRLDACMDTCAGWFEGPIELSLLRSGGGWRLRAGAAQLGYSGLELDGGVQLETRHPLRIATSPRSASGTLNPSRLTGFAFRTRNRPRSSTEGHSA